MGNRVAFLAKGSVFFLLDMYFEVCVHQHAVNLVVSLINCFSFFFLSLDFSRLPALDWLRRS